MSRLRGDDGSNHDGPGVGECSPSRSFGGRASLLVACFGIGLLLWARLVIVADMPRMALAEPDPDPATASAPAPDADGEAPPARRDGIERPD